MKPDVNEGVLSRPPEIDNKMDQVLYVQGYSSLEIQDEYSTPGRYHVKILAVHIKTPTFCYAVKTIGILKSHFQTTVAWTILELCLGWIDSKLIILFPKTKSPVQVTIL